MGTLSTEALFHSQTGLPSHELAVMSEPHENGDGGGEMAAVVQYLLEVRAEIVTSKGPRSSNKV